MIVRSKMTIDIKYNFSINEAQAEMLDWLAGCGAEPLCKMMKKHYGSQFEQHHDALYKFFNKTVVELGFQLGEIRDIRRAIRTLRENEEERHRELEKRAKEANE